MSEKTTARVPEMAATELAATVALATVDNGTKLLESRDAKVQQLYDKILQQQREISRLEQEVAKANFEQGKILISTDYISSYKLVNLDEAKVEIEKLLRKEFEKQLADAKLNVKHLTDENEKLRAQVDTFVRVHETRVVKAQIEASAELAETTNEYEQKLLKKENEISKLELKVRRLTEAKEFTTIEEENLKLKKRLQEMNKRIINWDYFKNSAN